MYPGTPALPTLPQIELPVRNIIVALGVSLVIMAVLARFLPKTSIYRRLVVSQGAQCGEVVMVEQQREQASRLGEKGVAVSNLRPGGKAQFGNDIVDVITQGEMIEKGQVQGHASSATAERRGDCGTSRIISRSFGAGP